MQNGKRTAPYDKLSRASIRMALKYDTRLQKQQSPPLFREIFPDARL